MQKERIMQMAAHAITTCLWFDTQAEQAANFYVSIFEGSRIGRISRYGKEGHDIHGKDAGSVMTVEFEIGGRTFVGLNGGPHFKFNEAVSFQVHCRTQQEIDYFWGKLGQGGQEGPCGWLKDKYGVSWQVVPNVLPAMLTDADPKRSQRVTKAFLQMKKFDIGELERAYDGARPQGG
jgi:predicted 3-demethylubiquinone-9 3-methyltransferase (glyoxalase superfamily)